MILVNTNILKDPDLKKIYVIYLQNFIITDDILTGENSGTIIMYSDFKDTSYKLDLLEHEIISSCKKTNYPIDSNSYELYELEFIFNNILFKISNTNIIEIILEKTKTNINKRQTRLNFLLNISNEKIEYEKKYKVFSKDYVQVDMEEKMLDFYYRNKD